MLFTGVKACFGGIRSTVAPSTGNGLLPFHIHFYYSVAQNPVRGFIGIDCSILSEVKWPADVELVLRQARFPKFHSIT